MKTAIGQLRYWTLFFKKTIGTHPTAVFASIINRLSGHVRKVAISAAFGLWGAAAFAQSDIHFAKKPLANFGLVTGSHSAIDVDSDGDMDMLTIVDGHLNLQINTPIGNIANFGTLQTDVFGMFEDSLSHVAVGDLDGDGYDDILLSQMVDTSLYTTPFYRFQYLKNAGTAPNLQFETPLVNPNGLNLVAQNVDFFAFQGGFYLADSDSDGDIDVFANKYYGGLANPCGSSGTYYDSFFSDSFIYEQVDTFAYASSIHSYLPLYYESKFLADIDADGSIDTLKTIKVRFSNIPLWKDEILLGNADTIKLTGLPNSHFNALQNLIGDLVDIDTDGDLDIVTHFEVLLNEQNHAPQCTNIQATFDAVCIDNETFDYTLLSFDAQDCSDTPDNLFHYIKREAFETAFIDEDGDYERGIKLVSLPDGGDAVLIYREEPYENSCFGSNSYTHPYTNIASIGDSLPYFTLPTQINSYGSPITYNGLFISPTNASFQFQVSDGHLWSAPCTYTLIVTEGQNTVYHDQNANGVQDSGEPLLAGYTLESALNNYIYTTDASGHFNIIPSVIGDTITPFYQYQVAASPSNFIFNGAGQAINFGVQLTPDIADLSVDITNISPFRPGFNTALSIQVKNEGTLPQSATVQLVLDNDITLTGTNPTATQSGDTLSWVLPEIGILSTEQFNISLLTPPTTTLGTSVSYQAMVVGNLISTETTPNNNSQTLWATVVGSYDPNDKACNFGEGVTIAEIEADGPFVYTVRFQNTGTYLADSVAISDTLDARFDLSTFKIESASHPMTYIMSPDGVATFLFDNILLPPSSEDEPGSHGFVKYSIKTDEPLVLDENIANTAYIYFDFNEPIITNTTQTTVVLNDSLVGASQPRNAQIRLAPNPTSALLNISFDGKTAPIGGIIEVYNALGVRVKTLYINQENLTFDTQQMLSGLYLCVAKDREGKLVGSAKWVKL